TLATPENIARFETRRAELERLAREHLQSAGDRAGAMKDFKLTIQAKAGTEGKLFGSIGTSDIAEACTRDGFHIERSEVRLPSGPLRVLGGLLLDPAAWENVADVVTQQDFYRPDHQLIFDAIGALAGAGKPCDVVTVSQHLESTGKLESAGGLAYLGSVARDTPTAANV